jgi:PKD repeat protein
LSNGLQLVFQQNCTDGGGACGPNINFSGSPTSGPAPLTVSFANLSTGATSYNWDFGDGKSSTQTNAINTYTNPGLYSVKLTGSGNGAFSSLTKTNYILVTNPPPPVVIANFSGTPTNGVAPLMVSFNNLSSGATNYSWDFGDGNSSSATNPANIYASGGTYSITLTAVGPGGTNVLTRTNYVVVSNPGLLVLSPASLNFGLLSTGATVQAALVLSNAGGATLTGSASNSAGPFSIVSGTPFAIGPAGSTNLVINFAPVAAGSYSNATFVSSDGGNASASLLGRAIYPPLLLSAPFDGQFAFSFETFSGFSYVTEYKDQITNATWLPLKTNMGDGTVQFVTNSVAAPAWRVYRVSVE